jgi:hypothetical protein
MAACNVPTTRDGLQPSILRWLLEQQRAVYESAFYESIQPGIMTTALARWQQLWRLFSSLARRRALRGRGFLCSCCMQFFRISAREKCQASFQNARKS